MVLVLALLLAIPLGLDLYMPIPDANPISVEKIELGRRLFRDRRLSRDSFRRLRVVPRPRPGVHTSGYCGKANAMYALGNTGPPPPRP